MRRKLLVLLLSCLILWTPQMALADIGPKPSITIIVEDPTQDKYYLDLVIEDDGEGRYKNIGEDEYDEELIEIMRGGTPEGCRLALIDGTRVPLFGELDGYPVEEGNCHYFSYLGVPDRYRILIGTELGEYILSPWHEKKVFQEELVMNGETGEIESPSQTVAYAKQFLISFALTLLIEGVVLVLMGYSLSENLRHFLFINFMTQVLLTAVTGYALMKHGNLMGTLTLIPAEIVVLLIEAFYYKSRLLGKNEKTNVIYALVANLASIAVGLWIWKHFTPF